MAVTDEQFAALSARVETLERAEQVRIDTARRQREMHYHVAVETTRAHNAAARERGLDEKPLPTREQFGLPPEAPRG